MAIDLEAARDLALIFERDDVHDAFSGHCCATHGDADAVRTCRYCSQLRLVLARAIMEWLALVDRDRAARGSQLPALGTLEALAEGWLIRANAIIEDVNNGHAPISEADLAHGWQQCADELEAALAQMRGEK